LSKVALGFCGDGSGEGTEPWFNVVLGKKNAKTYGCKKGAVVEPYPGGTLRGSWKKGGKESLGKLIHTRVK